MEPNSDPVLWLGGLVAAIYLCRRVNRLLPGFYQRYLSSSKWRRRRRWCLTLGAGLCRACKRPASQAHHRSYRFLASLTPIELIDLVPLCFRCHRGVHGLHGRRKRRNKRASLRVATNDYIRQRKWERIAA